MRFTKLLQIQNRPATTQTIHHHIPNGLNYAAYGRLLQHCTNHRLIRQAKLLHAKLILSSVTLDNFLASKFITFYSKTNNLFEAHRVFDEIPNKNTFSWNALIMGYSVNNKHTDTLKLFGSFLSVSSIFVKPDHYTVTCVLKALSSLGYGSSFAKTFHCYIIRNGLDCDIFVVNALITAYCRCDDVVTARTLFDLAPDKDLVSWNSMMAGYSQGGSYENCKELYLKMLDLEHLTPNEFTVISILQACAQSNDLDLGKWEEAEGVRVMLERFGLKKIAGCSWIETGSGMKSFVAKDLSDGKMDETYGVLDGLVKLMREERYDVSEDSL